MSVERLEKCFVYLAARGLYLCRQNDLEREGWGFAKPGHRASVTWPTIVEAVTHAIEGIVAEIDQELAKAEAQQQRRAQLAAEARALLDAP